MPVMSLLSRTSNTQLMKSEKCTGKVDESMSISTVEMIWK
jgi:hypothetical protein